VAELFNYLLRRLFADFDFNTTSNAVFLFAVRLKTPA